MIEEEECRVVYAANEGMKEFDIPFRFIREEHIKVFHDGSEEYVYGRDYAVTGESENGGKSYVRGRVVFHEAPNRVIAVVRRVPLEQTTDYVVNGDLPAETLEGDLDYLTMIAQQHEEMFGRSLMIGETSGDDPEELMEEIVALVKNGGIEQASKDICLRSAEAAANSAAVCAASQTFVASVMTELTGNADYLNGANNVVREVYEAKGAIEAAVATAVGNINTTADVALAAVTEASETVKSSTQAALTEMAESNLLSTTQQLNAELSAAVGADGVLDRAVSAARETIAGDVTSANADISAALTRAEGVVSGYVSNARTTVETAIADWTQIKEQALAAGDSALENIASVKVSALEEIGNALSGAEAEIAGDVASAKTEIGETKETALTGIQAEVSNAAGYSQSALGYRDTTLGYRDTTYGYLQDALTAATAAAASAASALAYKNDIDGIVSDTLTIHNASLSSHAEGFDHDLILHNTTGGVKRKVWLRNDGTNFSILLSDANGINWNSSRPITISLSSGALEIGTDLAVNSDMTVSGALSAATANVSGALSAGNLTVSGRLSASGIVRLPDYNSGVDIKTDFNSATTHGGAKRYIPDEDGWIYTVPTAVGTIRVNGADVSINGSGGLTNDSFFPVGAGDEVTGTNTANKMFFFPMS